MVFGVTGMLSLHCDSPPPKPLDTQHTPLYRVSTARGAIFRTGVHPFVFARASELQNSNTPSPDSLSKLHSFNIIVDHDATLASLDSILPLLQLKPIRYVTCPRSAANAGGRDYAKVHIPHVYRLSFPDSNVNPLSLAKFLMFFCGLTYFSYFHFNHETELHLPSPFLPPMIRKGIMHLEKSLQELTRQ